jgi:hypothetical protein
MAAFLENDLAGAQKIARADESGGLCWRHAILKEDVMNKKTGAFVKDRKKRFVEGRRFAEACGKSPGATT